jgi:hypothetical protein
MRDNFADLLFSNARSLCRATAGSDQCTTTCTPCHAVMANDRRCTYVPSTRHHLVFTPTLDPMYHLLERRPADCAPGLTAQPTLPALQHFYAQPSSTLAIPWHAQSLFAHLFRDHANASVSDGKLSALRSRRPRFSWHPRFDKASASSQPDSFGHAVLLLLL